MHEAQAFIKGLKKMHRLAVWTVQIGTCARRRCWWRERRLG